MPIFSTWQFRLGVAVAAILGSVYGGWWLRDLQAQAVEGQRATDALVAEKQLQAFSNNVASRTEAALGSIRIENRTIYNETQREIINNPVYRDCVLPPDGVRLANSARAGTAGKPGSAVPAATSSAGEGDNGRSAGR